MGSIHCTNNLGKTPNCLKLVDYHPQVLLTRYTNVVRKKVGGYSSTCPLNNGAHSGYAQTKENRNSAIFDIGGQQPQSDCNRLSTATGVRKCDIFLDRYG